MKHYDYLPESEVAEIARRFQDMIPTLFGDSLEFGFISGGFGKGYATRNHDIDMFICVQQLIPKITENFHEWYFDIHSTFHLPPDNLYPGEIVTKTYLEEKIRFIESRRLRPDIETQYEYEAILWGDIVSESKIAVVGDHQSLNSFEERCRKLARRWRAEIAEMLGTPDDYALNDLDLRRLFKKVITYHKRGDNTPPYD